MPVILPLRVGLCIFLCSVFIGSSCSSVRPVAGNAVVTRERISINEGWQFFRYDSLPDQLSYDVRPVVTDRNDNIVADSRPTAAVAAPSSAKVLKHWILPSGNDFINDPAKHHQRPEGDPGADFPFVQSRFDDRNWNTVNLPHDWAIRGPFYSGANAMVGGGMGRLPVQGVAWYRKKLHIPAADRGRRIYLEIDGAMSYTMVWMNGHLVGGWPYGYNSFRLDLTPYLHPGADNQLAIRLDNPPNSARWYPGAGIYRNVWLTKVNPLQVAQWGTFVTCSKVSASAASVNMTVQVNNTSDHDQRLEVLTDLYTTDDTGKRPVKKLATFPVAEGMVKAGAVYKTTNTAVLQNPLLWGPPPAQYPHLYIAVTRVFSNGKPVDEYQTSFGIRSLTFDAEKGLLVNDVPVRIQGVNQHHDLGALGAAFNVRAAERQLELLRELGCNAIRLAHNPPAPELLDLTDRMGFLVIDEIYDNWERKKTPLDFHLIFPDWHEPDTRAFVRRDRNHPSVIAWSFGNEVGEQYTGEEGAAIARKLYHIVKEEDSTRPATASMNYAKPDMPFPQVMDILSLNYQGEGIRDAPAYQALPGIKTSPLYPAFQKQFPGKMMLSSETSSALSSRGTYLFPVFEGLSAPVSDGIGGDSRHQQVSAYELYTAAFGASPDKVFATQDHHPYVAGEFVWSGFDYLGEPTPYYGARSAYSGILDLAGFKKDRFYLYQSRWRPEHKMAHILPHWSWPERVGMVTPVHVFTSGDEAELFLNEVSLGRKKTDRYAYRFRWDSVLYQPGVLRVVAYKNGAVWAADTVVTAGVATQLQLAADRNTLSASGEDLSFITLRVLDSKRVLVPRADNRIDFEISGPGEIIATDNGDPAALQSFSSTERNAFNGLALVIIRAKAGAAGFIKVTARAAGLSMAEIILQVK